MAKRLCVLIVNLGKRRFCQNQSEDNTNNYLKKKAKYRAAYNNREYQSNFGWAVIVTGYNDTKCNAACACDLGTMIQNVTPRAHITSSVQYLITNSIRRTRSTTRVT